MDSFELNKIAGAILGTLLFVMGVGFLAEAIYEPIEGVGPGYELPDADPAAASGEELTGDSEPQASVGLILASANAEDGRASARKCQSCHSFDQGGPNGQGPNLWNVVSRPIAGVEGYSYSEALVEHAAQHGNWTYEELNAFLIAPKGRVPGTKMNFAGVKDDQERGNIIAYLSTLSDSPVPFPAPVDNVEEATPGSEGAAPTATEANQTSDSPTTTQSETPVVGTPTGSNVPAGAESGSNPSPPPSQPTAPAPQAVENVAPTGGETAPAGEPAAVEGGAAAPAGGATAPATEGQAPAAQGQAPAAQGQAPAGEGQAAPAAEAGSAPRPAVPMTPPAATTTTAQ